MTQQNQNSAKNTTGEQNANKIVSGGEKTNERSKLASFEQSPYERKHFVDTSNPFGITPY